MTNHNTNEDAKTNVVRIVNAINVLPTPLTVDQVTTGAVSPSPVVNPTDKNSLLTVLANEGVLNNQHDSWIGSTELLYNRLDLGVLLHGVTVVWLTTAATSTREFAIWARDNLGINIYPEDLVDSPIDMKTDNGLFIPITAAGTSLRWIGETSVLLKKLTIDLTVIIPPGTRLPIYVAPEKISSFKAFSYNYDWVQFESYIVAAFQEVGNGIAHQRLSGVLLGKEHLDLFAERPQMVKYTGSDIGARGGRDGTLALYCVPALDLWLHIGG